LHTIAAITVYQTFGLIANDKRRLSFFVALSHWERARAKVFAGEPLHIFDDRLNILGFLFGGIRVIEPEREGSAIFLCQTVIETDAFGVSDVEVSIRLRRKSGGDFSAVLIVFEVFLDDLFDEVQRLSRLRFGHMGYYTGFFSVRRGVRALGVNLPVWSFIVILRRKDSCNPSRHEVPAKSQLCPPRFGRISGGREFIDFEDSCVSHRLTSKRHNSPKSAMPRPACPTDLSDGRNECGEVCGLYWNDIVTDIA